MDFTPPGNKATTFLEENHQKVWWYGKKYVPLHPQNKKMHP
jgi:hypothetical protein